MMTSVFRQRLLEAVGEDLYRFQYRNTDPWRFRAPIAKRMRRRAREMFRLGLDRLGLMRKPGRKNGVGGHLVRILGRSDEFERTYTRLGDEHSRRTLIEVLRFRILGKSRSRLALNTPEFWKLRRDIPKRYRRQRRTRTSGDWRFDLYQLDDVDGSVRLHSPPLNILNTFLLEQYAYNRSETPIRALAGETVIDAGTCWGDTALYFARRVGPGGRVYCFEFVPENLDILRDNLAMNPELAERIVLETRAVWERSDQVLEFRSRGPSTSLAPGMGTGQGDSHRIRTLSIDDLAEREGASRIDFIKMDIEGAELSALRGARTTLRRFRPKLAISVYHREEDLFRIPEFLSDLDLQYEFFLDHFTIHQEETVLFARPSR